MALPDTYKQVEYIESTGTQVLRIWSSWNNQYKTIIDYKFSNIPEDACLFWIRDSRYMRYYFWIYQWAWRSSTWSYSLSSSWTANTNRHTATITYWNLNIDWTSYTINSSSGSYSRWICLFWYSADTDNNYYGFVSAKVYSLKAYNGTTLIYDLIPVIRISDKKPGMYDLVNNVFYTNQGTWEFEYPKERWKIKKFLLWTTLIRPEEAPAAYEYSYDFRNKSVSLVETDWRTFGNGRSRASFSSNWLQVPTRGQWDSNKVRLCRPIDLKWAKKITMRFSTYWEQQTWGTMAKMEIADLASSSYNGNTKRLQIYTSSTSYYPGKWVDFDVYTSSWTATSFNYWDTGTPWTWTFTLSFELDLENKTKKAQKTWESVLTWTLTDDQISWIRTWWPARWFNIWHDIWTQYIQTCYLKVEY